MKIEHAPHERTRNFSPHEQTFDHPNPSALLEVLSWIRCEEYQSWLHIRDHFLDDPKSFPLNVETWLELRRLALRKVDRISLVCPSFGLSRSTFLGDESGMRDGLMWAVNKSLPPFPPEIFNSHASKTSKAERWLTSHYLRTWSAVAKFCPALCRACTGLSWEITKVLADSAFNDLAIEIFAHTFKTQIVAAETDSKVGPAFREAMRIRHQLFTEINVGNTDQHASYRTAARAYSLALLKTSVECRQFDASSVGLDLAARQLHALSLPTCVNERLLGQPMEKSLRISKREAIKNSNLFMASFWRTQKGRDLLADTKVLMLRALPETYRRSEVIQALLIAASLGLNLHGYELTMPNLRALIIALEKRLSAFFEALFTGRTEICGEERVASAQNSYKGGSA